MEENSLQVLSWWLALIINTAMLYLWFWIMDRFMWSRYAEWWFVPTLLLSIFFFAFLTILVWGIVVK